MVVSEAGTTDVVWHREGRVARVVLNRPEHRNGVTTTMVRELLAVLEAIALDRSITVLVLTGAGRWLSPGIVAFCSRQGCRCNLENCPTEMRFRRAVRC